MCFLYYSCPHSSCVTPKILWEYYLYYPNTSSSPDINFHRMTIYLEVLPLIPEHVSICLADLLAPLLGRIMYPLLKTSCSLFNVYLVCLSPPTVHTDYSAANAWRAVGGAEIRHDTWDRREDIPGKESFQDNLENKLETNPATILESHAVNVWWNYCVFALSP